MEKVNINGIDYISLIEVCNNNRELNYQNLRILAYKIGVPYIKRGRVHYFEYDKLMKKVEKFLYIKKLEDELYG